MELKEQAEGTVSKEEHCTLWCSLVLVWVRGDAQHLSSVFVGIGGPARVQDQATGVFLCSESLCLTQIRHWHMGQILIFISDVLSSPVLVAAAPLSSSPSPSPVPRAGARRKFGSARCSHGPESQRCLGWKGPRPSETINLTYRVPKVTPSRGATSTHL